MPWMMGVGGCAAGTPKVQWSPEEQERMHRFRGINGYEFTLSGAEEPISVRILGGTGKDFDGGTAVPGPDSKSLMGIYPPGLTKSLRVLAYKDSALDKELRGALFFEKIENILNPKPQMVERLQKAQLYDQTIAVADRIPDALLDELRRTGNGLLGIKLRIHPDGPLLGWHIEYRPNFRGFTRKEVEDRNILIVPAYSHTGGDFKEARAAWYTWQGDPMRGLPEQIPEFSIEGLAEFKTTTASS